MKNTLPLAVVRLLSITLCASPFASPAAHVYPTNPAPASAAYFGQLTRDTLVVTNPVTSSGIDAPTATNIAASATVTNAGAVAESKAYTDACCSTLAVASTNISYKAITNSVTSGYLCTVAAAQAMTNAVTFAQLKSKPTTLAGYGITNAYTKTEADDEFLSNSGGTVNGQLTIESSLYCESGLNGLSLNFGSTTWPNYTGYLDDDVLTFNGIGAIKPANSGSNPYGFLFGQREGQNPVRSELTPDGSYVVTSNKMHNFVADTAASKATEATVSEWETYWRGDRVRLSVTNYYGNTSGESPSLRIEEFDHSTTNGTVVSNFYHVVWDEIDRQTNYMAQTDAKVSGISNAVMDAAWRQTNLQLVNKAPRAWQSVTSAGEDAPPNMVWHTAPQSVFAGGTEYAHVAVGEGTICVLTDKGAPVYTDGAEGQFRFQDQSGQNYFGFDVRSSYKIGCRTDGISVNSQQHIVSLTYDLTSATNPSILHSTNLVDWADAVVEWEQNPPAGTKVCYINCGNDPKGFYQAEIRYAGGSKFLTNMQADLMGGIAASNQTLNVIQSVEPYIISNQVMWRVKQ